MMGVINNAYLNSCSSLIISKYYGDIEDLKTAPLSDFVIINALSLASCVRGIIVASVIFFVGEVFSELCIGSTLLPERPLLVLYFLIIAGCSFGVLGAAIGAKAKTFEMLNSISQFILLPLIYLGGVFYSINYLPPFWQKIALCNPMFYYIDGMRYAFFSVSEISPILSFSVTLVFFLSLYGIAYKIVATSSFKRP